MRFSSSIVQITVVVAFRLIAAAAVEPEIAELSFDGRFDEPGGVAPVWITTVEQQGGKFISDPRCWQVAASEVQGAGRLSIALDRRKINQDLVATILFDTDDAADIALQLFDAQGRVVVVDLFGNLVDVGKEATTNTYIIPLRRYPTAEKIVLRRVKGEVRVYGMVLYPVVTEQEVDKEALHKLARVLGDPLSPENPLVKSLQHIARNGNVSLERVKPDPTVAESSKKKESAATNGPRGKYPAAVRPEPGTGLPPTDGLVAYWNFDNGNAADLSGRKHDGQIRGAAQIVDGLHGKAIGLRGHGQCVFVAYSSELDLNETLTVSAWIKYSKIAPIWGSQIVFRGDEQFGRDPSLLHLLPGGTLQFRSDRSVTGKPIFQVFDNEIQLSPKGVPIVSQHVAVNSAKMLAPDAWYFVAATIEKISPRLRAFTLYVNDQRAGFLTTEESVNYETNRMGMTIGAADGGGWQNFDGLIDEVRVYNRPLSPSEIKALYNQPRQ